MALQPEATIYRLTIDGLRDTVRAQSRRESVRTGTPKNGHWGQVRPSIGGYFNVPGTDR